MRRRILSCPGVLAFNGTNTKLTGQSLGWTGAQPLTLAVWMKFGGTAAGNGVALCVGESVVTKQPWIGSLLNKANFGNYGSVCGTGRPTRMDWCRILATFNGTHAQFWTNAAKASDLTAMTVNINTSVPYLGDYAGGGYTFKGKLWRAMIWNRPLTDSEIERDFFDGEIITSGLVRHWPLEVLSGGTTPELIGGTLDTVANGAINTTDLPFKARTAV